MSTRDANTNTCSISDMTTLVWSSSAATTRSASASASIRRLASPRVDSVAEDERPRRRGRQRARRVADRERRGRGTPNHVKLRPARTVPRAERITSDISAAAAFRPELISATLENSASAVVTEPLPHRTTRRPLILVANDLAGLWNTSLAGPSRSASASTASAIRPSTAERSSIDPLPSISAATAEEDGEGTASSCAGASV